MADSEDRYGCVVHVCHARVDLAREPHSALHVPRKNGAGESVFGVAYDFQRHPVRAGL
jgi:hypothetical protein